MMNEVGVIILAAGQGKRMKSALPKVTHLLGGKPLLLHVLERARRLHPGQVTIVGHGAEAVKQVYPNDDVTWVVQDRQLGTAHAVLCARNSFKEFVGDILILSGDVPLISERTLKAIIDRHHSKNHEATAVSCAMPMVKSRASLKSGTQRMRKGRLRKSMPASTLHPQPFYFPP
jgi:bifunctional UDP-N-acetylglucosamine pyrophosphorylase/glucosamine-1-phosphate N-acetyltransferase